MPLAASRAFLASSAPVAQENGRRPAGFSEGGSGSGRLARRCSAVLSPTTRLTSMPSMSMRARRHGVSTAVAAAPSSSAEAAGRREASAAAAASDRKQNEQLVFSNNVLPAPSKRSTSPSSSPLPSSSSIASGGERTRSSWVPPAAPILSGGGGGVFFFWQLGAIDYMSQRYDLDRVHLRGASAGGLAVTLAACGVRALDAAVAAHELSLERGVFERPTGLAGVWGGVVRAWLDALLPRDAAARCAGRLKLVVTKIPSLRLETLESFADRRELIDACLASAHVPFFLDGKGAARFRGEKYVDGSLYDFIYQNNSDELEVGGKAFVLDYCRDDKLEFGRLDFLLKRLDLDGAKALMAAGAEYARRQEEAGVLDEFLGSVKRERKVNGNGTSTSTSMTSGGVILPSGARVQTPEAGLAA